MRKLKKNQQPRLPRTKLIYQVLSVPKSKDFHETWQLPDTWGILGLYWLHNTTAPISSSPGEQFLARFTWNIGGNRFPPHMGVRSPLASIASTLREWCSVILCTCGVRVEASLPQWWISLLLAGSQSSQPIRAMLHPKNILNLSAIISETQTLTPSL